MYLVRLILYLKYPRIKESFVQEPFIRFYLHAQLTVQIRGLNSRGLQLAWQTNVNRVVF